MDWKEFYNFMEEALKPKYPDWDKDNEINIDLQRETSYFMDNISIAFDLQDAIEVVEKHKPKENWGLRCLTCGGTGTITTYENGAPMGAGYWAMPVSDDCPDCIEKGLCPNCGLKLEDMETAIVCPRCAWDESVGAIRPIKI